MFGAIGFGLLVGSCCTLISSLSSSSFSLRKSFVAACKSLNLTVTSGDTVTLPIVNAEYSHSWGTRLLVSLPVGLSSSKVMEQQKGLSEALRHDIEMTYKDGLIVDIFTQPMPDNVPFEVTTPKHSYKIPIGVNRRGDWRYYDFDGKFPHLLIGGISGGGKSVILRAILTTLVTGPAPDMYLCDLKGGVELGIFRNLACVKGFSTALPDVLKAATDVEAEMNRRYAIMAVNGSQEWQGKKVVFVMDELADLKIGKADTQAAIKGQIKSRLTTLSAKGRAAGVLLVLCTQRPDASVVDGLIKTNVATSICFRTRDGTQSRIILDHDGAADLPEIPGRLIFQQGREEVLQAPFLSAADAKKLISDLPKNQPAQNCAGLSENPILDSHSVGKESVKNATKHPDKDIPLEGNSLEL
ncbi:FtsK/SpoIIIE domain-containing protein [Paenibacillus validus]|uniref:FtsK/SpoIIIE domain-containing protein n=1 Tax=Paenibacillus validus TaxID=44253 RepID=UPI000FDB493B|nr:FtsK/SpoIIIE domain-containing protein [Paenibacillus validus]MED4599849.1 FtsK/SpoIIIE domain-containing protein [Paenibacillus validus]MED4606118.1 FtsK/SpoIIIE domain-containing protein [Paenibacillus validus]